MATFFNENFMLQLSELISQRDVISLVLAPSIMQRKLNEISFNDDGATVIFVNRDVSKLNDLLGFPGNELFMTGDAILCSACSLPQE